MFEWVSSFAQVMIFALGITAIWLTTYEDRSIRRWAYVFGLASQPFWFFVTYQAQQWGIFFMSFVYLMIWFRGFLSHWIKRA